MYKSDLLELNAAINEKSQKLSKEVLWEIMQIRREVLQKIEKWQIIDQWVVSMVEESDWYKKLPMTKKEKLQSLLVSKLKKDAELFSSKVKATQLEEALSDEKIKKLPHITEHRAREKMDTKRRKRFYTFQTVFSDFNDFIELKDDDVSVSKEDDLIPHIVIDPTKITDSLLLELSHNPDVIKDLLTREKTETKKSKKTELRNIINVYKARIIPDLKDILSNTYPVAYGEKGKSGRVNVVNKKDHIMYGKLMLIGSPSFFDEERPRTPIVRQTVSVFDNMYDFIRSQYHTLLNISEEKNAVWKVGKEVQRSLIAPEGEPTFFDVYASDMYDLLLQDKTNYHLARAWDRIEHYNKSKGKNPQIDRSRMYGVAWDLGRRKARLAGQEATIGLQITVLQDIFRDNIDRLKAFHNNFYDGFLKDINVAELEAILMNNSDMDLEFYFESISPQLKMLKNYLNQITWKNRRFMPYPFNVFFDTLDDFEDVLWKILLNRNRNKEDIKSFFRSLFIFNLEMKKQKVGMLLLWVEHVVKIDKMAERWVYSQNEEEKKSKIDLLITSVNDTRTFISQKHFLWSFMPWKKAQAYFEDANKSLEMIHEFLKLWQIDVMRKYLEE